MPKRLVNEVTQARFQEAGSEVARFLLNTTVGVAGFVDVASRTGLEESDADTGQTLGVYGAGPGPYLVVPLLLTVCEGIGYAVDSLLDPLSWFVTPFVADFGRAAGKTINDRAANLKLYQDLEILPLTSMAPLAPCERLPPAPTEEHRRGHQAARQRTAERIILSSGSRYRPASDSPGNQ
jgi:hypothetical protein